MASQVVQAQDDPNLLARIGQAAEQAGLGQHRSAYPVKAMGLWKAVRVPGVLELVGVAALLVGVFTGSESLIIFSVICCCIVGFFLLLAVIGSRLMSRKDRDLRLDLYEYGLVQATGVGIRIMRYDNAFVKQTIVKSRSGTTYRYNLSDPAGTEIELTNLYPRPQEWGSKIQDAVTTAQLPGAWSALQAGHRVEFGPLWLTLHEIGGGQRSVPWSQVQELKIYNGSVSVRQAGQWFSLVGAMVRGTPNFFVFQALAEHLRKTHGGEGTHGAGARRG